MESTKNAILKVSKVEVVYNHVSTAVQGVSFTVQEGQIFAIIGANGAGKTTTLRALSGFLGSDNAEITDGEIVFLGKKINNFIPHQIVRMGMVLVPERTKTFDTLTVEGNLAIAGSKNKEQKTLERKIFEYFPRLLDRKNRLAGFLSGGEKQMLAIGQALNCQPKLLLIDEVSMGLAPLIVSHLLKILTQMRNELDLTILIVEQNAAAALKIADYAVVMENGRIVFDGTPQKLLAHEDVREFYLGVRDSGEKKYTDIKQYKRTRRWWG